MIKKQHHYCIAYAINNKEGNFIIVRKKKIKSVDDFTEIAKLIAYHNNVDAAVITNIMYLGKERVV